MGMNTYMCGIGVGYLFSLLGFNTPGILMVLHGDPVWSKNGSVANNVFEGNKGFYLRVPQTRIVNFTGVFQLGPT